MAGICEAGHRSETDDYCDTCGLPVRPYGPGESAQAAARPAPPPPSSQSCPNCGAHNPPDALFCEACGYDYTTGTLPRSDLAGMLGLTRPAPQPQEEPVSQPNEPSEQHTGTEADSNRTPVGTDLSLDAPASSEVPLVAPDAEQQAAEPQAAQAREAVAAEGVAPQAEGDASPERTLEAPEPLAPPAGEPGSELPADDEPPTQGRPAPRRETYVAEVWIDPDWYDVQSSPDAMPSVGLPETVKLGDSNLIGRESRSRNIVPEIDCGVDTGCSRRQAMLTTDGTRWYVEDLGSANGTFVGPASGPLPTDPIKGRTELGPDDRIYVGAWTRIVVRKASREELDALG